MKGVTLVAILRWLGAKAKGRQRLCLKRRFLPSLQHVASKFVGFFSLSWIFTARRPRTRRVCINYLTRERVHGFLFISTGFCLKLSGGNYRTYKSREKVHRNLCRQAGESNTVFTNTNTQARGCHGSLPRRSPCLHACSVKILLKSTRRKNNFYVEFLSNLCLWPPFVPLSCVQSAPAPLETRG